MLFSIFFRRVILKKSSGFIFVDKMYNSDEILFILSAISSHFSVEKKSQVIEICAVKSQVCTYLSEGNVIIKLLPFSICLFHPVFFMQCLFNVIWSGRPSFIENLLFLDEDFQDAIAIKCGVNWNEKKWLPKVFVRILIELSYFIFFIKAIDISREHTNLVITGDNSYRYGCLTKYSSFLGIPVITNINMNEFNFSHYSDFAQFSFDKSTLEDGDLDVNLTNNQIKIEVDDYFSDRFGGRILQHDIIAAHSKEAQSFKSFPINRPIVTIFSHVLCDAPSNIPGKLHADFKNWFLDSLKILIENKNINVCVKEHPSASLYGEEGLIRELCIDNNLDISSVQFVDNVLTDEVLEMSDFVITCSGTVGLEGLYKEKQVVVASDVFYAHPELLHAPKDLFAYHNCLRLIGADNFHKKVFTDAVKIQVYTLLYYYFFTLNNRQKLAHFPLPPYVMGVNNCLSEGDYDELRNYLREKGLYQKFDSVLENKKFKWVL